MSEDTTNPVEGEDTEIDTPDTDTPRTPEEAAAQRAKRAEQNAKHPKGSPPGQAGKTHPRDIDTTTPTDGGTTT